MIKYSVSVPMGQLLEARRTCRTLKKGVDGLRQQLEELEKANDGGDIEAERQRINSDIKRMIEYAVDNVQKRAKTFRNEVEQQEVLKGEALKEPDYALIRDEQITDAEQLRKMADRNAFNYTILVAIDHYASNHKWPGFVVVSDAPMIKAFGNAWFHICEMAASNPDGLAMMQIQAEGELYALLQEYGCLDAAQLPEDEM